MANKTFYIQEDVQEDLEKEENKGGLINDLLREYYDKIDQKVVDFETVGIRTKVKHEIKDNKFVATVTPNKTDVRKYKTKIKSVLEDPRIIRASDLRPDNGTCKKHGTPLTAQGKCLQKGH